MKENECVLWLNLLNNGNIKSFYTIMDYFGSAKDVYMADEETLLKCRYLDHSKVLEIQKSKNNCILERHLEELHRKKIQYFTVIDKEYPITLKNTYHPPPVLYYYGKLRDISFDRCISIVGSRNASYYGLKMSKTIALELSRAGITVVSGLARGVDSMAHLGALEGCGKTIAVLGNGIDVIYPKENSKLYNEIKENGLVVSEHPPGIRPYPYNFPRRNRIISGLSLGTLVIEAAEKSGSLITARHALEQGREVYALPGNVDNPNSKGTNALLKEGAKVVTSSRDILEDVSPMFFYEPKGHDSTTLEDDERVVLDYIKMGYSDSDKLALKLNKPVREVQYIITKLEIKDVIEAYNGQYYVK